MNNNHRVITSNNVFTINNSKKIKPNINALNIFRFNKSKLNFGGTSGTEVWNSFGGSNLTNMRCTPSKNILKNNIKNSKMKYSIQTGDIPNNCTESYGSITADRKYIYYNTISQYDDTYLLQNNDSYLVCAQRNNGHVVWKKKFSSYSGIQGDFSRSAPVIHKNNLYVASSINMPCSLLESPNGVPLVLFDGNVQITATDRLPRLYCINKSNGEKIWEKELEYTDILSKANYFNAPCNWSTITQSPIVCDILINNAIKSVIIIGVSSNQSSILPRLSKTVNGPFIEYMKDYKMTDTGALFILNAEDGDILKAIQFTPKHFKAGDVLTSDAMIPGRDYVYVLHTITQNDLINGGSLNPVSNRFANFNKRMTWILNYDVNNQKLIPQPLNGIIVKAKQNKYVVADKTLSSTETITEDLHNICVELPIKFVENSSAFLKQKIVNGSYVDDDEVNVFMIDETDTYNLQLIGVKILKKLYVGDILNEDDAYQLNYYGCSIWTAAPCINTNDKKVATEVYIGTGNNNDISYDEAYYFDRINENYSDKLIKFFESQKEFMDMPLWPTFYQMRKLEADLNIDLTKKKLKYPISIRGQNNLHSSIIAINLRDGLDFGKVLWSYKTSAYDVYHSGFVYNQRSLLYPTAYSDSSLYYGKRLCIDGDQICPILLKKMGKSGNDILFSSNKAGIMVKLEINKSSHILTPFNINTVNNPEEKIFVQIGNSGEYGGSNYSLCSDGIRVFSVQAQSTNGGYLGLLGDNIIIPRLKWFSYRNDGTYFDNNQSFVSAIEIKSGRILWEAPIVINEPQTNQNGVPLSIKYSAYTGTTSDGVGTGGPNGMNIQYKYSTSVTNLTCTKDLLFVPGGDGKLHVKYSINGLELKLFTNNDISASSAAPIILNDGIYYLPGAQNKILNINGSKYNPSKALYVYK
jgi:outer membrane protein assembly factor BamB